ncbi:hypothetical protein ECANGB1_1790 [Enterospora canceri]|uniref:Uncharacterized protein n=1 Tax=Enterospora canceri TaxID=1081671 RepID=A0A1Y1S5F5_9MICR|nr:hypothetical protein ECANGB1_1790 [Enterospora canceri]
MFLIILEQKTIKVQCYITSKNDSYNLLENRILNKKYKVNLNFIRYFKYLSLIKGFSNVTNF